MVYKLFYIRHIWDIFEIICSYRALEFLRIILFCFTFVLPVVLTCML